MSGVAADGSLASTASDICDAAASIRCYWPTAISTRAWTRFCPTGISNGASYALPPLMSDAWLRMSVLIIEIDPVSLVPRMACSRNSFCVPSITMPT